MASMEVDDNQAAIVFPPVSISAGSSNAKTEIQRISVPSNRISNLRRQWSDICSPIVSQLSLQIRFNVKTRCIEIRPTPDTKDASMSLQKAVDFTQAIIKGFSIDDSIALIRLDDLFVETFEVTDVKMLAGDHLSRAIGRIAGHNGRTKFTIENVTRTRIVLAGSKVSILGSYQNIRSARRAICNLILGRPPSKVYGNMRAVASRMNSRL